MTMSPGDNQGKPPKRKLRKSSMTKKQLAKTTAFNEIGLAFIRLLNSASGVINTIAKKILKRTMAIKDM